MKKECSLKRKGSHHVRACCGQVCGEAGADTAAHPVKFKLSSSADFQGAVEIPRERELFHQRSLYVEEPEAFGESKAHGSPVSRLEAGEASSLPHGQGIRIPNSG